MTPDDPAQPQDRLHPDSPPTDRLHRAMELISSLCEERIDAEQTRELETLVLSDPQIQDIYLRMMHLDADLHHYASALGRSIRSDGEIGDDPAGESSGLDETMVIKAVPAPEPVESEEFSERFQPTSVLNAVSGKSDDGRRIGTYIKAGIAAALLLGFGLLTYTHFYPRPQVKIARTDPELIRPPQAVEPGSSGQAPVAVAPPPVIATLDLSSNAVWGSADLPPAGGKLIAGTTLSLKSGAVQLKRTRGGKLVVEGPLELRLDSDTEYTLQSGRIAASIPGGGLTLRCPTGSVTDLGTEFGVAVNSSGQTEVDVFEGRVTAALSSTASTEPTAGLLLKAGQAATMTEHAVCLDPEGAVPQRFVCSLINPQVKSLDVTDLVSGGDGTTQRRGIGIDPTTGEIGSLQPVEIRSSDGKYHRTKGYPFVDGAFVPDGGAGPMAIDSAGHRFDFSGTGNGTFNNIFTGGKIPWPAGNEQNDDILSGVDYAAPGHSVISIHANGALTLDLNAVRRLYPDRSVTGFKCIVGNTCHLDAANPSKAAREISDSAVRVLIDGISRYENPKFSAFDGAFPVNVPLRNEDRFLTLASTNVGKRSNHCWVIWADAKLDLAPGK
jgi:hypothetical protein